METIADKKLRMHVTTFNVVDDGRALKAVRMVLRAKNPATPTNPYAITESWKGNHKVSAHLMNKHMDDTEQHVSNASPQLNRDVMPRRLMDNRKVYDKWKCLLWINDNIALTTTAPHFQVRF